MEKKYQVFISSTYQDLFDERKKVINILLSADCIPAGMEAFVATDEEQFSVIKKVIDLCDYYILILGNRYGSINEASGISYTEMEYDYAITIGIPVLVFALNDESRTSEEGRECQEKLKAFKNKAMKNRLASMWTDSGDLQGKVSIAIMKAKTVYNRPGWVRACEDNESCSSQDEYERILVEFQKLTKENDSLKNQMFSFTGSENNKPYSGDYEIFYRYRNFLIYPGIIHRAYSWNFLFMTVSLCLVHRIADELTIEDSIKKQISSMGIKITNPNVIKIILSRFEADGLIQFEKYENSQAFYSLTGKGSALRNRLLFPNTQEETEVND